CELSATARRRRLCVPNARAVPPDQVAVRVHLAVVAQVADEVPVQPRLVAPTEMLEGRAERDVHGAADLLVEEDVAGEAVDLVVEPERGLAENPRARIHLEERREVVLTASCLCRDDTAALEAQPHVLDLAPVEARREREADLTFRCVLRRARAYL